MAQAELNVPDLVAADPPPPTDPTPVQPTATEPVEEVSTNPQVVALQAIFPDFEPIVLQSVLDSVNGSQDGAIDKLLGMSDPEYKEQHSSTNVDQTELDEEFARSLLIQEQEEANRRRQQRRQQHAPPEQVSNQQRAEAPVQNPPGTGPNMQEVTDTFNRLAETGKKTFNTLFSKVKAKIQELDQPRTDQGATTSTANSGGLFSGAPSHHDRHSMMTQAQHQPADKQPIRGYDTAYQPSPTSVAADQPTSTSSTKPDQRASSPEITLGSNHSNQQASNIDPAKLGILPKRPVTLGGSSPPKQGSTEELEYIENPFEDGRHK